MVFRTKNEIQTKITNAFIEKFQLSSEELIALHGDKKRKDLPVTFAMFETLDKVQRIHQDCKALMQSGHETLALDIMETMTLHQVVKQVIILFLLRLNVFFYF